MRDHDHLYHRLFENPAIVAELLRDFVAGPWLDDLGFRCARVQSDSIVSETERRAGRSKRRERSDQAATTSPKRR